jgi:hypothetical protein
MRMHKVLLQSLCVGGVKPVKHRLLHPKYELDMATGNPLAD